MLYLFCSYLEDIWKRHTFSLTGEKQQCTPPHLPSSEGFNGEYREGEGGRGKGEVEEVYY